MINLLLRDYFRVGEALYGKDRDAWQFICPMCKNVQSVASVVARTGAPRETVEAWIMFDCEGRLFEGKGCDWTLGGLIGLQEVEVLHPESLAFIPVFAFADPTALDMLRPHQMQRPEPQTTAAKWSDYAWPEWVPQDVRAEIEKFWDDQCGRGPEAWELARCGRRAPEIGTVVTMRKVIGKERVRGRFVFAWNGIGRVIDDAGVKHVVAF